MGNVSTVDLNPDLIKKYAFTGPTTWYVEYPHKTFWKKNFTQDDYKAALKALFSNPNTPALLYVHIPFCHSQCLFCFCRVEITSNYEDVKSYMKTLHKEVDLLRRFFDEAGIKPNFKEMHLGGGSPTYLQEKEFREFMDKLSTIMDPKALTEFSIEVDPRRVKKDKLKFYHDMGVTRISMGVQDFELGVQQAINRVQPAELVERVMECRDWFKYGVNFDIICGLPRQTKESIRETVKKVLKMSPDRISLLNFDYTPKFNSHQVQMLSRSGLPDVVEQKGLFAEAAKVVEESGQYDRTSYDHFAKPQDEVAEAKANKKMIWNTFGSSPGRCVDTVGIGIHSYSRVSAHYYAQNFYDIPDWEAAVSKGEFPLYRGMKLNDDDILRREVIHRMRLYFRVDYAEYKKEFGIDFKEYFKPEFGRLEEFEKDGLIKATDESILITEKGKPFTMAVCRQFDKFVWDGSFDPAMSLSILPPAA